MPQPVAAPDPLFLRRLNPWDAMATITYRYTSWPSSLSTSWTSLKTLNVKPERQDGVLYTTTLGRISGTWLMGRSGHRTLPRFDRLHKTIRYTNNVAGTIKHPWGT